MATSQDKTVPPTSSYYLPADFYMLRAPALPAELFFQLTRPEKGLAVPDLSNEHEISSEQAVQQCHQILRTLLAQPFIAYALAVASFSLHEGLSRLEADQTSKRATHTFSRLLRYMVRMCSRPTPFGLFAGVASGTFADRTSARLATPVFQHVRTRPDMRWLYTIIHQIEHIPELVEQLCITTNQTIYCVNGRASLPVADVSEKQDTRSISLRLTATVQFVFEQARRPIRYAALRDKLAEAFPQATRAQIDRLLWQLWENGFLISDLRPPLTHEAPAHYVLERLRELRGAETFVVGLEAVFQDSQALDQAGWQGSRALLQQLVQDQAKLVPDTDRTPLPFQIDASLRLTSSTLHRDIGQAAARVAELLPRLIRRSRRSPHLRHYYEAFLERYGAYQEVPLLELLSPETGLDAPATYQNPPRTSPASLDHSREPDTYETTLLTLVMQAVNEKKQEVVLTDALIQQLDQQDTDHPQELLPSVEIYLQIAAASQEALDQGQWRAVLSPICGSPAGGRTFGRFCDLFSASTVDVLRRFIQHENDLYPDVIFAELSYLPQETRLGNVSIRPQLRPYEIVVGVTPSVSTEYVIPLEDLVVGVRDQHFYVRSRRLGKEVIACQTHMLNLTSAPNACRFLLEIHGFRFAPFSHFDWGSADTLPFLPRLVYQKMVLQPARWNLRLSLLELPEAGSAQERWRQAIQQWRSLWRVPRFVYLKFSDNRLLLDLEHPSFLAELQEELTKLPADSYLILEEMLPDFDHLWLEDEHGAKYFAEVVVPLRRIDPAQQTRPQIPTAAAVPAEQQPDPLRISRTQRLAFPGTSWIYLKLYAAYKQHEELIAGPLRESIRSLQTQGLIDSWFFIRYADTAPHVRLRVHIPHEQTYLPALEALLAWARQLAEHGQVRTFCLDTYDREVERYGGPQAMDALEHAFMADSVTTSTLIAALYQRQLTLEPLEVAVFSLDRLFNDWGLDLTERREWARQHVVLEQQKEFHARRRVFCDLLLPWQHTNNPGLMEQRALLNTFLAPQQAVIAAVSTHVRILARQGELWRSENSILQSLAHMHINRLLENGYQKEQQIYSFWRQTLESLHLRPGTGT